MGELLRIAYLAELALWVPLAALVVAVPGMRRWLAAALGASALAMAYEGFMTFVWAPTVVNPIRVDIFLVMAVTGAVNVLTGLALLGPARSGTHRRHARAAAALCLGIPLAGVLGLLGAQSETASLDRKLDFARQARFEAAFRDADTERRFYGSLAPSANPWAGYYAIEGADDRFRRLVVNDAGRFWLYHETFYEYPGEGRDAGGEFRGRLTGPFLTGSVVVRRRGESHELEVESPGARKVLTARRMEPPRFPVVPSSSDEVRFVGVFSGTYESPASFPWVVQVWLWESGGEVWGRYLREPFKDGRIPDMLGTEKIEARCREQCAVLEFATGRGPVTMRRVAADEWRAEVAGFGEEVVLRRGERQEGFDLDLAPLASVKANRAWLEAMTLTAYRREAATAR